jgi:hypothetical protein
MYVTKGYIYLRENELYDIHNAYKMGETTNILERDIHYSKYEITKGVFKTVYEIDITKLNITKNLLEYEFLKYYIKHNSEKFYNKQIINMIEPILIKYNIQYKKLNKVDIDRLLKIKSKL